MKSLLAIIILIAAATGVAEAYPQFQLSRDQTCTGCHLSPAGGGLLNENGLAQSESLSKWGTNPGFFYSSVGAPGDKLVLGGDARGFAGYYKWGGTEDQGPLALPMQLDMYARLQIADSLSFHVTGGFRPAEDTNANLTHVWAREHYLTWQQKPGENYGMYIRAGRFMPVFGLRFVEHPLYTRRWGGTQLYSDTYGLAVENVQEKYEWHATAFMEDFLIDPVEHANGAAAYGEMRLNPKMSVGLEGMFKSFSNGHFFTAKGYHTDYREIRLGATHKVYLEGADLLLQTEVQFVNGLVSKSSRSTDAETGGAPKGIVGALVATRMVGPVMIDVALQHYDSNYRVKNDNRDAGDLNVHLFATSHVELILTNRYEMIGFGAGGESTYQSLLQLHYRM